MQTRQMITISTNCPDCGKTISFAVPVADLDCASDGFDEAGWEHEYTMGREEYVCPECYEKRQAQEAADEREADREAREQDAEYRSWVADGVRAIKRGY